MRSTAVVAADCQPPEIAQQGVTHRGTPAKTEQLDLIYGIIARICRSAREVVRETSNEAIATELSEFYPPRDMAPRGVRTSGGGTGGGEVTGGGTGGDRCGSFAPETAPR